MGGNFGRGVRGSILKPTPIIFIYSRTSLARTCQDRLCEFDPSMCSSDNEPDSYQVGSCVLYVITDITFVIDQSCKAHVTPVSDQKPYAR